MTRRQNTLRYDGQEAATYARVIRFIAENYLSMDEDWVSHLVDAHESMMTDGIEHGYQAATLGEMIAADEGLEPLPEDYTSDEQAAPEEIDPLDSLTDPETEGDDDEEDS